MTSGDVYQLHGEKTLVRRSDAFTAELLFQLHDFFFLSHAYSLEKRIFLN